MTASIIDDRDPSITYFGHWHEGGVPSENGNTTMYTRSNGSYALFSFSDAVDTISVWGTIGGSLASDNTVPPKVSFQIDGQQSEMLDATMPSYTQYRQQFFEATGLNLSSGQHTLNMTSLQEGGYFYLDYVKITLSSCSDRSISETTGTATLMPATKILTDFD